MSRRLAVIVFALGVIAAPLVSSLVETVAKSASAQGEDLIVVQPAPFTAETYLELVKQKIELLSPEELARETAILRKALGELQAHRKLREAEKQLQQLIDQFPGSAAAERALVMLKTGLLPMSESESPFSRDPEKIPTPDDDFGRSIPRGNERDRPNLRRNVPNPVDGDVPGDLRVEPRDPIKKPFDPKKKT